MLGRLGVIYLLLRRSISSLLCLLFSRKHAVADKPIIVVIAGAWHTLSHYEPLLSALHVFGYNTRCPTLPSLNPPDPMMADAALDANFVRKEVLLPPIEDRKEVVLVLHSYSGLPGSAGAKGLSKTNEIRKGLRAALSAKSS